MMMPDMKSSSSHSSSSKTNRFRGLWLVLALVLSGSVVGGYFGKSMATTAEKADAYALGMSEILAVVEREHIAPPSSRDILYGSIRGMTDSLDPHSNFLDPSVYRDMQEKQEGSFYGIGIVISRRGGKLTVVAPIEGTPADRLGVRTGDVIVKIEDVVTADLSMNESVNLLRGPKGSDVTITVQREGLEATIDFTITRAEIPSASVSYSFMLDETTGYIKFRDFTKTTTKEVRQALEDLRGQGMTQLLLDLRGNPGGLLSQAVSVSELFLKKGQMIVYTQGRAPGSNEEFYARTEAWSRDLPLIILVSRASASASEIVAGAVQDHDRGLVVGDRTWGKGLVQSVYSLRDGSALALTTAKYFTPSGRLIQRAYDDIDEYYIEGWQKSIEDDLSREKQTMGGRTVYGGGGISPDIEVLPRDIDVESIGVLRRNSLFFRFGAAYVNTRGFTGDSLEMTDALIGEFLDFAKTEGVEVPEEETETARPFLNWFIEQEIVSAAQGLEAGTRLALTHDYQVEAAMEVFNMAEALLSGNLEQAETLKSAWLDAQVPEVPELSKKQAQVLSN